MTATETCCGTTANFVNNVTVADDGEKDKADVVAVVVAVVVA